MSIILGIDTGGTYTDAALFEQQTAQVLAKAKSPTTREDLSKGIESSITALNIDNPENIERVVLSTTLATNAIVEGEGRPTGLIIIGEPPKGTLPDGPVARVAGKVNVKGKVITPIDEQEVAAACDTMTGKVEAIAVAGMMSVRNAELELGVKAIVADRCGVPVVCSHELSTQLGFHDRTVTCILNASLIPILQGFVAAVQRALTTAGINAPIYMVKGDGNLASLDFIQTKPIESILSGPAASIIGALGLAGLADGIVVDMGGTTTDSGIIKNHTLALSPIGARVGEWQTQIDSAMINTYGLGGDTEIIPQDGQPIITAHRVLPVCRGGNGGLTPTDCLHITGEFECWNRDAAVAVAETQAEACGYPMTEYVNKIEEQILSSIEEEALAQYDAPDIPVIAIGAPAGTWYGKLKARGGRDVIIPEHFEVANAVGAAMAAVEERVEALVRPDEENDGYVGHVAGKCQSFSDKDEAVAWVAKEAESLAKHAAQGQGSAAITSQVFTEDIIQKVGWQMRYVETQVRAVAKGNELLLEETK